MVQVHIYHEGSLHLILIASIYDLVQIFSRSPELNQTFLFIFYDLLPGVLLVAALISIYFLCQSVKIWIMFPILFWVCVSIFLTPQLTCWGEIEFKRCYKISNVPAGMHLVVLLLSRHSPHWNSISSQQFFVSPNLYSLNNSSPFQIFFLNMMHEGQLSVAHVWLLGYWCEYQNLNLTTW